jgi:hypothetical protein
MKKILTKTKITKTVLLILTLTMLSTTLLFVQADPDGIGKFVNITVIENQSGEVTLTKLSSGETWVVNESSLIKVGAGTVKLSQIPNDGYTFEHWLVDGKQINDTEFEFKTSKGITELEAHFIQTTYYITAIANGPGTINGATSLIIPVQSGESSPVFEFTPVDEELYHISSIQIDTTYIGYTTSFTFPTPITSNHSITVNFGDAGVAIIPAADNVSVFLNPVFDDSVATLIFNSTNGGKAEGNDLFIPAGSSILFWNITTNATDFDTNVTISLQFDINLSDPVYPTAVYRAESADALYSDVNMDGVIDGTDVSWVAQGIKTTVSSGAEYNPLLDIDRDGDLDEADVQTVNENRGAELIQLTFDIIGNTIYIQTDHFTLFRCR